MESRIELADKRHGSGYNCSQAVACTYCDLVGIDEAAMFSMVEGLGFGMGNMEGTCGALSGACILAGLKNSCGNPERPTSKGSTYRITRQLMAAFKEQNSSVICKELKGIETGEFLRSCRDCVTDAAEFVEKILFPEVFGEKSE